MLEAGVNCAAGGRAEVVLVVLLVIVGVVVGVSLMIVLITAVVEKGLVSSLFQRFRLIYTHKSEKIQKNR